MSQSRPCDNKPSAIPQSVAIKGKFHFLDMKNNIEQLPALCFSQLENELSTIFQVLVETKTRRKYV